MKKHCFIIIFFSVLVFGSKSNAQIFIGGGLSLKNYSSNNSDISGLGFSVSPEIGYTFTDRLSVGCNLKYVYRSPYQNSLYWSEGSSISVFGRYGFLRFGSFSIYLQTSTGMGVGYINDVIYAGLGSYPYYYNYSSYSRSIDPNLGHYNFIGVYLNPGISYSLGNKVLFLAKLGELNYTNVVGMVSNTGFVNYNFSIFDLSCVVKL
jgi:hypothetical protein